jgi:hypothetical protein
MELRSSGIVPEIKPHDVISPTQSSEFQVSSTSLGQYQKRSIDIDFSMKISKKSELMELLKIFQNQIDMIKITIDKLIKTTEASDNEIVELSNPNYSAENGSKPIEDFKAEPVQENSASATQDFLDLATAPDPVLTDLPPKPRSFKDEDRENFIGLPRIEGDVKLKPLPKKSKLKKKDLVAEKEALRSKLNSVRNLINFVEKKLKSGEIDKKSYDKRISKLKTDLQKTQDRLDEINKLL